MFITSAFDRALEFFTYLSYDSLVFAKFVRDRRVPVSKPFRILDYCCGTGYVGLTVKGKKDDLTGVDISQHAILMARINAALQGEVNSRFICSGHFPDGMYDLITCNPPFVFMKPGDPFQVDSNGGGEVRPGIDPRVSRGDV